MAQRPTSPTARQNMAVKEQAFTIVERRGHADHTID